MNDNEYLADGKIITDILNEPLTNEAKVNKISNILNDKYNLNQSPTNILFSLKNLSNIKTYTHFKKYLLFKIVGSKEQILTIDVLSTLNKMDPEKKTNPKLVQELTNKLIIELDYQVNNLKKIN